MGFRREPTMAEDAQERKNVAGSFASNPVPRGSAERPGRYTRALDEADSAIAFTRLWGVLELLTGTTGKYDLLVDRVAFLSEDGDRRFITLLLEHLRDVRNGLVHTDESRSNVTTYLDQLKWMTELMLRYHLRNGKQYKTLSCAAQYLDTPTDRTLLARRLREYRRALGKRW